MTFLLCDPVWFVHKPDVQNKWDDNTHTNTHHSMSFPSLPLDESFHQQSKNLVPPTGGCMFFAENNHPGGNSKVGGGIFKKLKN